MNNNKGFGMLEVTIALGLIGLALHLMLDLANSKMQSVRAIRALGTRDRVAASLVNMILIPAALRNSARATSGSGPTNVDLANCVYGLQSSACPNGVVKEFDLFSPVVVTNSAGAPIGVQRVGSARRSESRIMVNSFGALCQPGSEDCLFNIFTRFRPQCGPAALPLVAPVDMLSPNLFLPLDRCTIAQTIEIIFSLELDSSVRHSFALAPVTGSALIDVKSATGNDPQ